MLVLQGKHSCDEAIRAHKDEFSSVRPKNIIELSVDASHADLSSARAREAVLESHRDTARLKQLPERMSKPV